MNKIIVYTVLGFITLGVISCTDWLGVRPQGETILEDFWKTGADVESVIATCYREMQEDDFMQRLIVWGEMRSDNVIGTTRTENAEKEIIEENLLPSGKYCQWVKFYSVINYCNTVLHYGQQACNLDPNFTLGQLNAYFAEAITLRALCYFYLIRVFGDVPYITMASLQDKQNFQVAKTSAELIQDSLIIDLLQAEKMAMSAYGKIAHTKGRVTKSTVRAILADIYLWKEDYQNCINYCDKILNDEIETGSIKQKRFYLEDRVYSHDDPFTAIFYYGNSTESIFELQFNSSIKANSAVGSFYGNYKAPEGKVVASDFLGSGSFFKATDERGYTFFYRSATGSAGYYNIFKFQGIRSVGALGSSSSYYYGYLTNESYNWILYRLPDIMLMKAEALTQLERLQEALWLVNTVRRRANPTALAADTAWFSDYNTKTKMEELVLLERQKELLFEGKRWFDLMRLARRDGDTQRLTNLVVRRHETNQIAIRNRLRDMRALYWPIHESDLKVNKLLEQNPYYSSASGSSASK